MNDELYQLILSHFNEPMLCGLEVVRCIGYGGDDMDCYIIMHGKKRIFRHTCVGGYTFLDRLKGQDYVKAWNGEDWDDMYRLNLELQCAGVPLAEKFLLEV